MGEILRVQGEGVDFDTCRTVLLVPARAVHEPGYIKALALGESGSAKHEFHALAQMAYFQFQDEELRIIEVSSPLLVDDGLAAQRVEDGMILLREGDGGVVAVVFKGENRKKLLEAVHRYCTRWVRLDI